MDRTLNNILYEHLEYEDYEAFVNAEEKIIGKAHNKQRDKGPIVMKYDTSRCP